jgi:hypothetical protein
MKSIPFHALLVAALFATVSVTYAADRRTNLSRPRTETQADMLERGLPAAKWSQLAKVTASDGEPFDWFGTSEAISADGKTVVFGAPYANKAYVFVKPASGWHNMTQIATLKPSDAGFAFGYSVAMSGNTVVIGDCTDACSLPGTVYVFVKPAGGWVDMTERRKTDQFRSVIRR